MSAAGGGAFGPLAETVAETLPCAPALVPGVQQVGIVVDDLDGAIAAASRLVPATVWRIYRYGPDVVQDLTYRGRPSRLSFWVALSDTRPQVEYIQPLDGPSLYHEWLEARGTGVHHVGVFTEDLAAETARLVAAGYPVTQSGHGYGLDGDGGFAYLDTFDALGVVLELIAVPARRRPPHREIAIVRT